MIGKLFAAGLSVFMIIGCVSCMGSSELPSKEKEVTLSKVEPLKDSEMLAQALGGYCCDAWGVRRCVLAYPSPLGSSCYCYGQGYGYSCP